MSAQTSTAERLVTVVTREPGCVVYRVVPVTTAGFETTSTVPATVEATAVPVEDTSPIPIVVYTPSQLYLDGDPARGFRPRTTGTPGTTTWAGLARLLSRAPEGDPNRYPDANVQKSARGGWSACSLTEGRRLGSAFVETSLLGLDIDKNGNVEQALRAFEPFKKIVHSTYKSTDAAPRCRVILKLKDPCRDADQFRRAHRAVRETVVLSGWFRSDDFDDAGSDPSRLWFLPMVPPGGRYIFHVTGGELLDLSKLVTRATAATRRPLAKTTSNGSGALAWAHRKMADAPEGHRHTTVFSLAAWLAEITPALRDTDILSTLMPLAPHGRQAEFERTVLDGIRQGRAGR